ncbi:MULTISPECIES: hypothetical protein [unclassified Streptomyces]|uniref:hypothetical protein n=1 Tax=unclassified Streptomyces TaxID=2593676 RepID=UPI00224D854A|nr:MULTISPECIES: hypothetical protein [unclassified Streptomyces]MCX5139938.1 hypothetical protein [Streptomyces sp. NBC_00338]
MERLSEIEECILINAREMSSLWSVLADWTESEDEDVWVGFEHTFASIMEDWIKKGYLEIYEGEEWPAHEAGYLVPMNKVHDILANHESWMYVESPTHVISLLPGVNFSDLLLRLKG